MAKAKKKSKAKKSVKKSKAKTIKKSKAVKKKKSKKTAKRAAAKAPVKSKKSKKPAAKAKKPAKKIAPKKKQIVGEGDYAATRKFDKDQASFVKRNKARIPELGKQAEAALDGPEGDSLRAAEQEARDRSTI